MHADIAAYNARQNETNAAICAVLAALIDKGLRQAESKLWHGGPVWFLDGNPIAGYFVRKHHVTLLFWSGQSFETPGLKAEGKFKAADVHLTEVSQIDAKAMRAWLKEAQTIQWDYKNIVKRKGRLEKIGGW
jgi:hypothetical protein